jgi:hypothetical protein
VQPLAPADSSPLEIHNNLSRSVSLSVLDRQGNELAMRTTSTTHPFQFIIPRDPNTFVPPMIVQNVTSMNNDAHRLIFNLHYLAVPFTSPFVTDSIHVEMQPLKISRAYLFIYRFDTAPQMNSSVRQIDGWSLLCPSSNLLLSHLLRAICPFRSDQGRRLSICHRQ